MFKIFLKVLTIVTKSSILHIAGFRDLLLVIENIDLTNSQHLLVQS